MKHTPFATNLQLSYFRERFRGLSEQVLDLLFPPRCVGCKTEGSFLCPTCLDQASRLKSPLCSLCGEPISPPFRLCSHCQQSPLKIYGIYAPFIYQEVIKDAIQDLKYNNVKALAAPLARILAGYLETTSIQADVIVPVPLHWRRLRERGYNQAALMARELGKNLGWAVEERELRRTRYTKTQVRGANREQRRTNVRGAFDCRGRAVEGKRVLLVDDVCTTGSTLEACAMALRQGGATAIWGLTLAR